MTVDGDTIREALETFFYFEVGPADQDQALFDRALAAVARLEADQQDRDEECEAICALLPGRADGRTLTEYVGQEVARLEVENTRTAKAAERLFRVWDMSAGELGPEWYFLGEVIDELRAALGLEGSEREAEPEAGGSRLGASAVTEPCTCSARYSDHRLTVERAQCPRHGTHGSASVPVQPAPSEPASCVCGHLHAWHMSLRGRCSIRDCECPAYRPALHTDREAPETELGDEC